MRHFLDLDTTPAEELRAILGSAAAMKAARAGQARGVPDADQPLKGRIVALIFEKPSTRTRVSFDVGVERIFPLYAPTVDKVEKIRSSKVRRSKLYYLRGKSGKDSRLKEIVRKPVKDPLFAKAQAYKASKPKPAEAAPAAEAAAETPA